MSLAVPTTFVDLQTVTAAQLNSLAGWYTGKPTCVLGGTTGTTITTSTTTWTTFTWTNALDEIKNVDAMHSTGTNPTRITINTAGLYMLNGSAAFGTSTAGTGRGVRILKNGAALSNAADVRAPALAGFASGTIGINPQVEIPVKCIVGDYFELQGIQDTGSNTSFLGYLSAIWKAP